MTPKTPTDLETYDRLTAEHWAAVELLNEEGTKSSRDRKLQEIADAAIAGEPLPDSYRPVAALTLQVDALLLALRQVANRVADGAMVFDEGPVPRSSAELTEAVANARELASRRESSDVARKVANDRYTEALDEYGRLCFQYERTGLSPIQSSEKAKAEMEDPEGLWPPGSTGPLHLEGRPIAETVPA